MLKDIVIRPMLDSDIDRIVDTFSQWGKELGQYQKYWHEQQQKKRVVLVALHEAEIVGYVTVVWQSGYEPFRQEDIPEIVDLNVNTEHQRQGIGTALIHTAEQLAAQRSKTSVGISVEQSPAYAASNRLYPKLGYMPDGRGITQQDNELHLVKALSDDMTRSGK